MGAATPARGVGGNAAVRKTRARHRCIEAAAFPRARRGQPFVRHWVETPKFGTSSSTREPRRRKASSRSRAHIRVRTRSRREKRTSAPSGGRGPGAPWARRARGGAVSARRTAPRSACRHQAPADWDSLSISIESARPPDCGGVSTAARYARWFSAGRDRSRGGRAVATNCPVHPPSGLEPGPESTGAECPWWVAAHPRASTRGDVLFAWARLRPLVRAALRWYTSERAAARIPHGARPANTGPDDSKGTRQKVNEMARDRAIRGPVVSVAQPSQELETRKSRRRRQREPIAIRPWRKSAAVNGASIPRREREPERHALRNQWRSVTPQHLARERAPSTPRPLTTVCNISRPRRYTRGETRRAQARGRSHTRRKRASRPNDENDPATIAPPLITREPAGRHNGPADEAGVEPPRKMSRRMTAASNTGRRRPTRRRR